MPVKNPAIKNLKKVAIIFLHSFLIHSFLYCRKKLRLKQKFDNFLFILLQISNKSSLKKNNERMKRLIKLFFVKNLQFVFSDKKMEKRSKSIAIFFHF